MLGLSLAVRDAEVYYRAQGPGMDEVFGLKYSRYVHSNSARARGIKVASNTPHGDLRRECGAVHV